MEESDAPFVFTNAFRRFPNGTGYEEIDHVDGPSDTCDWTLAAEQDRLIDCGFPGIAQVTCEKTFGCCYDQTGEVPFQSNCYVGASSSLQAVTLYDQKLAKAEPTAISFDGETESSHVDISDAQWMSKGNWTVAFWLMPLDRTPAMGKAANVLTFTNTGSGDEALHIISQPYRRTCPSCTRFNGGELRVDVLPINEAAPVQSVEMLSNGWFVAGTHAKSLGSVKGKVWTLQAIRGGQPTLRRPGLVRCRQTMHTHTHTHTPAHTHSHTYSLTNSLTSPHQTSRRWCKNRCRPTIATHSPHPPPIRSRS